MLRQIDPLIDIQMKVPAIHRGQPEDRIRYLPFIGKGPDFLFGRELALPVGVHGDRKKSFISSLTRLRIAVDGNGAQKDYSPETGRIKSVKDIAGPLVVDEEVIRGRKVLGPSMDEGGTVDENGSLAGRFRQHLGPRDIGL
jgi:hypothetical protein